MIIEHHQHEIHVFGPSKEDCLKQLKEEFFPLENHYGPNGKLALLKFIRDAMKEFYPDRDIPGLLEIKTFIEKHYGP